MRLRQRTERRWPPAPRGEPGFTLLELLIVMVIIGIIIAFILTAAWGGVRRAEERATQALVIKLDHGMADRVDALLSTRADSFYAHYYMALIANSGWTSNYSGTMFNPNSPPSQLPGPVPYAPSITRAQIIARFDQVKAELPDVFVVQVNSAGVVDPLYPLNFAATPYPGTPVSVYSSLSQAPITGTSAYGNYLLPLGVGVMNDPFQVSTPTPAPSPSYGSNPGAPGGQQQPPQSTGIFGASYTAASGLMKSLVAAAVQNGATPPTPLNRGYDGVDNDGTGLIDDLNENGATVAAGIKLLLTHHTHKTARAEMLYALLVEGQGPFGSVFSRDDFSDQEVKDTDGDGLPEFVDAWGEPIQFYRWPVFYLDDLQKHGAGLYNNTFDTRELDPLDSNQQLLNPSWWGGGSTGFNNAVPSQLSIAANQGPLSNSAYLFQAMFTPLTDPNFPSHGTLNASGQSNVWDRGATSARRAYFSRFLILSGGPDKTPGVPVLDASYYANVNSYMNSFDTLTMTKPIVNLGGNGLNSSYAISDIMAESQAFQGTPGRVDQIYWTAKTTPADIDLSQAIQQAGADDISSHTVLGPGGAIQ